MATVGGPRIVRSGLVLNLDAAQRTSYTNGSNLWRDLSGSNYNATLYNTSFSSLGRGSILFNGTDAYADLGNILSISSEYYTFCMWVWIESSSSSVINYNILNKGNNYKFDALSPTKHFTLRYLLQGGAGITTRNSRIVLNTGQWYFIGIKRATLIAHVFFAFSKIPFVSLAGITTKVFTTFNSSPDQIYSTNSSSLILAYDGASRYTNMNVACFYSYNRALDNSEIEQIYNTTRGRFEL